LDVLKRVILLFISVHVLVSLLFYGIDRFSRYQSWRGISHSRMPDAAQWYISNRAQYVSDVRAICFYALDCDDDHARLALVRNLDGYDFEALRERIWARRFGGTCQGYTANVGLHILRSQDSAEHSNFDHAIWSFYHNRFIPVRGHRNIGGAFSEEPYERCSMDGAAFLVENGVVY